GAGGCARGSAATTHLAVLTGIALDRRGGPPQARAHLVDLDLDDRALVAVGCLPVALLEPPGDDHPGALFQRLGGVLRLLAPARAAEEGRLLMPLVRRAVLPAAAHGDAELRHRLTASGEPQLGVVDDVAD